jgi:NADPH:quinone reductase
MRGASCRWELPAISSLMLKSQKKSGKADMKAILVREFGAPEVMEIGETDTPEPAEGQVLVRIKAAGVNPVDTYIRAGQHSVKPELPYTPGKDAAGVVERVGPGVERWQAGDRVFTADTLTGTYAEFAICREDQLGRLPDNVSFEQGAGVFTPYATAYRALFQKAEAKAGESVLVHGASGGVGIAAVQFAVNAGLKGYRDRQLGRRQGTRSIGGCGGGFRPFRGRISGRDN